MILINIPEDYWEEIDKGMKAEQEGKALTDNPFPEDSYSHDAWIMGYLAEQNGWDVEF